MSKPFFKIEGCEQSAFRLLLRAKNAMRDAGWSKEKVQRFSEQAGQADVVKFHFLATPTEVYQRVFDNVKLHCEITYPA